jgi:ATP-dependent Clp protease ATP-binding subunit ClpA
MTPRLNKILEIAEKESSNRGHGYVGVEHVLYAILSEKENIPAKIFDALGMTGDLYYLLGRHLRYIDEGGDTYATNSEREEDPTSYAKAVRKGKRY